MFAIIPCKIACMTYGKRLDQALKARGWKDSDLARRMGVTAQTVSSITRGDSKMFRADNHEKAVEALGIRGTWLALDSGPMEKPLPTPSSAALVASDVVYQMVGLSVALRVVIDHMTGASASSRRTAALMFGQLADNPDDAQHVLAMIEAALSEKKEPEPPSLARHTG